MDGDSYVRSLFLPRGSLFLCPLINSHLSNCLQSTFPVAAEYESEYLGDEVIKLPTIEVLVALAAALILTVSTAYPHLARGKTSAIFACFTSPFLIGTTIPTIKTAVGHHSSLIFCCIHLASYYRIDYYTTVVA